MPRSEGYRFHSATDTEVIAHLIASCLQRQAPVEDMAADEYRPLVTAVKEALSQLQGTYGLTILFRDWPEVLVVARLGSPIVLGVGHGEALHGQRRLAAGGLYRQDYLSGRSRAGCAYGQNPCGSIIAMPDTSIRGITSLELKAGDIDTAAIPHYMLKEF